MTHSKGQAPVTRAEVDAVLSARGLTPRHRFGQNFLVRGDTLDRIVALGEILEGDVVLEPGPGLGALTERLLARGATVVAVEIDRGLFSFLCELFEGHPRFLPIHGDVMERKSRLSSEVQDALVSLAGPADSVKVVSNLPYQISSPFLSQLVTLPRKLERAVVMVQREIASVLRAAPGSEDYSPLSFLAAVYLDVSAEMELGPDSFHPRPKVRSSVVKLLPRGALAPPRDVLPLVRKLFQRRRKTLLRNLLEALGNKDDAPVFESVLERVGLSSRDRVDLVEPGRLVELALELRRGGWLAASVL